MSFTVRMSRKRGSRRRRRKRRRSSSGRRRRSGDGGGGGKRRMRSGDGYDSDSSNKLPWLSAVRITLLL